MGNKKIEEEIRESLSEFRKTENETLAYFLLEEAVLKKLDQILVGTIPFADVGIGEKFIDVPLNIFECCRIGQRVQTGEYVVFIKTSEGLITAESGIGKEVVKNAKAVNGEYEFAFYPSHPVIKVA
jgi:hypothetical protein